MKKAVVFGIAVFLLFCFFSFKLTKVPSGLTIDEAAFGYNGLLLSRTLHDENGRFLPAFVLSLDRTDWRQPYTQYLITIFFKLFGSSVYVMRVTSVVVSVASALLTYWLGRSVLGGKGGFVASTLFITTPIVIMHSHLALDPIALLPFVLTWMIAVFKYRNSQNWKWAFLVGLSLGFGYYSYRGMRAVVPVWLVLSAVYIVVIAGKENWKKTAKHLCAMGVGIAPFILVAPVLEFLYAGAVFNKQSLEVKSVYDFVYYYLGSFDLSFLFIRGDEQLFHGTGIHGMFLLSSLPLFLIGAYKAIKERNDYLIFSVGTFILGPLLYGFLGSTHRGHRLMFLIPSFALISGYGLMRLWKERLLGKYFVVIVVVVMGINYGDFLKYYWGRYAEDNKNIFLSVESEAVWRESSRRAGLGNKVYIDSEIKRVDSIKDGMAQKFLRSIYFNELPEVWDKNEKDLPLGSVLISPKNDISSLTKLPVEAERYSLYIKE